MDIRRLKQIIPWTALNLFAVGVLASVLSRESTGGGYWTLLDNFRTGLESARWAARFLLVCLSMSPFNTYAGWRTALKLRKSAGLWSLAFAALHVYLYISDAGWNWLSRDVSRFLFMGLLGFVILIVLGITSNRLAMRHLKRNWKRIHRLVYLAGAAVVYHAMLATSHSKRLYLWDPDAVQEINAYIGILTVLLVVRLPAVRSRLLRLRRIHRARETAAGDLSPARPLETQALSLPFTAWIPEDELFSDGMNPDGVGEKERSLAAPIRRSQVVKAHPNGHSGRNESSYSLTAPEAAEAEPEENARVPVP